MTAHSARERRWMDRFIIVGVVVGIPLGFAAVVALIVLDLATGGTRVG